MLYKMCVKGIPFLKRLPNMCIDVKICSSNNTVYVSSCVIWIFNVKLKKIPHRQSKLNGVALLVTDHPHVYFPPLSNLLSTNNIVMVKMISKILQIHATNHLGVGVLLRIWRNKTIQLITHYETVGTTALATLGLVIILS